MVTNNLPKSEKEYIELNKSLEKFFTECFAIKDKEKLTSIANSLGIQENPIYKWVLDNMENITHDTTSTNNNTE